jgi:uncharacterized protein (DUF2236 family)
VRPELEQGRDHHPSAHVLNALARALQLDEDATAHLHSLFAADRGPAVSPVFSPGVNVVQATFLDPEVRRLVGDAWDTITRNAVARLRVPGRLRRRRSPSW